MQPFEVKRSIVYWKIGQLDWYVFCTDLDSFFMYFMEMQAEMLYLQYIILLLSCILNYIPVPDL